MTTIAALLQPPTPPFQIYPSERITWFCGILLGGMIMPRLS